MLNYEFPPMGGGAGNATDNIARRLAEMGHPVSVITSRFGEQARHEITGPLRFLNHNCRANAELASFRLVARRPIRAGNEITVDYGEGACECRGEKEGTNDEG